MNRWIYLCGLDGFEQSHHMHQSDYKTCTKNDMHFVWTHLPERDTEEEMNCRLKVS